MTSFRKHPSYLDMKNPSPGEDGQGSRGGPLQYRVLVVDDDEPLRRVIADVLSSQGHQCMTASNGVEALDHFRKNIFDAVITDIEMPEMDGIALTKELLSLCPDLPVMIMTGYGKEYLDAAIRAGVWDFIRKPFSVDEFILRFSRMMDYCHHNVWVKQKFLKEGIP